MQLIRTILKSAIFVAAIGAGVFALPYDARALAPAPGVTSFQFYLNCLRTTTLPIWQCKALSIIYDPAAESVTGLTLTVKYDPARYSFNSSLSGPLGIFSVGGDAPPPDPGIGTQLVQELPAGGITHGAPLPGSILTLSDSGSAVTLDYQLGSPVTVSEEVNFFMMTFDFLEPVTINLLESTATFLTSGEGADFSVVSFACTTLSPAGGCGSGHPATGVTLHLAFVSEPSVLVLFGSCVVLLAGLRRRRIPLPESTEAGRARITAGGRS